MRPDFTKDIQPEQFKAHYWEKKELLAACRMLGLPTAGSKEELTDRIHLFLKTGEVKAPAPRSVEASDHPIEWDTPVRNYRSDAATRAFFEKHIKRFRFNLYLREHAKQSPQGITYGDLVEGWKRYEEERKTGQVAIGKQFQYNQFMRDYFKAHPHSSRTEAIQAWKKFRG